MTTSLNLIMERMATFYTITRKREADPDYKVSANDMRQNNAQWLAMTAEFNKQITIGEDKRRHAMLDKIFTIVTNSLMLIEDEKTRTNVRKALEQGFLEAGL
jgi:adenosyl cobinamide kinase/adenosyl cobinamide phosphate guanylyltransferase